jgi:hypothetical protein
MSCIRLIKAGPSHFETCPAKTLNALEEIMSEAHEEHVSPIKTPTQLIVTVVAAFVIPIAIIVLLVMYVGGAPKTGAGSNSQSPESIAARIKPIADEGYQFGAGSQAAAGDAAASETPTENVGEVQAADAASAEANKEKEEEKNEETEKKS